MVKPADGALLDTQRISEPTDNKPERQNDHSIEDCQQDSSLKVSDLVSKTTWVIAHFLFAEIVRTTCRGMARSLSSVRAG